MDDRTLSGLRGHDGAMRPKRARENSMQVDLKTPARIDLNAQRNQ